MVLEVCWHDAFFGEQLEHELHQRPHMPNSCQTVEPANQPGPGYVEFVVPPATIVEVDQSCRYAENIHFLLQIVFIVSNKRFPQGGGMVILDDLEVSGQLCGDSRRQRGLTAATAATNTPPAPDRKLWRGV